MRVVVDGVVYRRQKFGGINVIYNEILPRMVERHGVRVELLVPRSCPGVLPNGGVTLRRREILGERTGLSWKLDQWVVSKVAPVVNMAFQAGQIKFGKRCLFQSTYFTLPPCNVPHVATAHDMNHELFPQWYDWDWGKWLRRQYREYIRRATRVIAVSHKTKKDVVEFYGVDPAMIDVVQLAVNRDAFYPARPDESRQAAGRPYLLFVGGRQSYKNFACLLEAVRRLSNDEIDLVVAGAAWNSVEQQLITDLRLNDRVRLVVNPEEQALRRLYIESFAFIYPSLHEGFGLPILEAMACGAPVIASDTEIFREVCGSASSFFDPHDPDAIAEAVRGLGEGSRRAELVALGRERATQFSWDRCADETVATYERALGA